MSIVLNGATNVLTAASGVEVVGNVLITGTLSTSSTLNVNGDLVVSGTTTTVNSTTTTYDDPLITLGGDTSTVEATKDRGVEMKWAGATITMINFIGVGTTTVTGTVASTTGYATGDIITIAGATGTEQTKLNGTWKITVLDGFTFSFVVLSSVGVGTLTTNLGATVKSKNGFFGLDQSTGYFTFVPQANITAEVVAGAQGTIQATNFLGNINGNTMTAGTSTYTGTAGQTYTFPSTTATIARIDAANSFAGIQTFTNTINFAAGSTTVNPALLTSGPLLTSPLAGSIEYLTATPYFTPSTANRAVIAVEHFANIAATQTGTDVNTVQPWLVGTPFTAGSITLIAATTYEFEGKLILSRTAGTTSHTTGIQFGGAATITAIGYEATVSTNNTAHGTLAATQSMWCDDVALYTLTAANTSATEQIYITVRGTVRINAGGTFIPQFIYSVAPGGAPSINIGTYFKLTPIGTNTAVSTGNWA